MVKKFLVIHVFLSLAAALFLYDAAAGNIVEKKAGVAIPAEAQAAKLAEVLGNPAAYDGKTVLLEGIFTGACPSLCHFTYSEGAKSENLYPQGFTLPKMKKGQRVRVYAEVTAGKERAVISVVGLEALK